MALQTDEHEVVASADKKVVSIAKLNWEENSDSPATSMQCAVKWTELGLKD